MLKLTSHQIVNLPKQVKAPIAFFYQCGDVHPVHKDVRPIFEDTNLIIASACNENFMYYWFHPENFPNLKTIYVDRICDNEIFRFDDIDVYTTKYYYDKYVKSIWNNKKVRLHLIDEIHFATFTKIAQSEKRNIE